MGYNQSKQEKEIIVSQAGNSGGVTSESEKFSTKEVVIMCGVMLAVAVIIYIIVKRCQKSLDRRIRREVSRSQELYNIASSSGRSAD